MSGGGRKRQALLHCFGLSVGRAAMQMCLTVRNETPLCRAGITHNVLGIGEEGASENRQPILAQMYNRITNAQLLPSAPFLPIPC